MREAETGPGGRLPVAVLLPPPLANEVTRFVERELGWQRVSLHGPPPPALLLASGTQHGDVPTVVLRTDGATTDPGAGVVAVIAWPDERDRLSSCAAHARAAAGADAGMPAVVVAGTVAGAGASTVALALAGLLAWAGRSVAVVGDGGLLRLAGVRGWRGPGADELAELEPARAREEFPRVARHCRAVPGLWLLHGSPAVRAARGWPVDRVLLDAGCSAVETCDVVVTARDGIRLLLRAGRPPVDLAWSARVARAGQAGRVPAGLPGSWLAALRSGLRPW